MTSEQFTIDGDEVCGTNKKNKVITTYGIYDLFAEDEDKVSNVFHFLCLWGEGNNYFPIIKDYDNKGTTSNTVLAICSQMEDMALELYQPTDVWGFSLLNEFYTDELEKLCPFVIEYKNAIQSGTLDIYPDEIKATEFYGWGIKYLFVDFRFQGLTKEKQNIFKNLTKVNFIRPGPNQIRQIINNTTELYLPTLTRQIVINSVKQYAVNKTLFGRQSLHGPYVYELIAGLKREYKSGLIELKLVNTFNGNFPIILRLDISNKVEETIIYAVVLDDSVPQFGTLRYPAETLEVYSVQQVNNSLYHEPLQSSDFISNVIVANAAMAAAMIGGGLLSGLGQGFGAYGQSKALMEMQQKQLAWLREQQGSSQDFQRGFQQSMFDFQSLQQQRAQDFQFKQQSYGYQQQQLLQSQAFRQQDKYQLNQNQFTKELVESNTDADIRKARYAQQLAGYRTDGAVYGLSQGTGRGGLGHPDAPIGATLMPRSVSTQTNSPNVYLTKPTGSYVGPMSNRMDF
nr:MAG: hypothetical protein BWR99_gp2 [Hubei picorna-like virus 56]